MRQRWCVLVTGEAQVWAVGNFSTRETANAYAASLPAGQARGLARLVSTDMYRVQTGNGVRARRPPAEPAEVGAT